MDKKTYSDAVVSEREYIHSPHPKTHIVSNEEIVIPEEPITIEASISALVQQAVNELRAELKSDLALQIKSIQSDLQVELKGVILNVENQELSTGGRT